MGRNSKTTLARSCPRPPLDGAAAEQARLIQHHQREQHRTLCAGRARLPGCTGPGFNPGWDPRSPGTSCPGDSGQSGAPAHVLRTGRLHTACLARGPSPRGFIVPPERKSVIWRILNGILPIAKPSGKGGGRSSLPFSLGFWGGKGPFSARPINVLNI